ncbi:OR8G5-like [Ictidomys tridecemlineatus]|uniref:G-protein coupled receptors family 1 profile domain-containing protein n=1 Tax=Ictidomys tridecemlineatus TaxID=43179 RepID=A0A287D4G5_ICTTR|nr:OR8G5-like [Ictidomys tridecemlineatus]
MTQGNHSTTVTEFILDGLTNKPELQLPLFLFFMGIYMFTVVGNLGMIMLVGLSSHLHTPMYYSSAVCLSLTSANPLSLFPNFVMEKNIISYPECMTQLYFFLVFIISECHMLAAMAYDCYVAICNPLLYNVTMSSLVCFWLVVEVYSIGLIGATVHTVCMLRDLFCKADIINHYFCDVLLLLELSCSSTFVNKVLLLCFSVFNVLVPTLTILSSYIFIIARILCIHSTEGRAKAFSMCSSHISAIALLFGSVAFMYLQPMSISSMDQGKVSSVFYTIIVLRNKDVKLALLRATVKGVPANFQLPANF